MPGFSSTLACQTRPLTLLEVIGAEVIGSHWAHISTIDMLKLV